MTREVFVAGQILTAAEMNVVSDQTVMSFAGTAARGSAIPSPTEGMVSYLEDVDRLQVYNTDWQDVQTGFTAGTVITASGTAVSVPSLRSPIVRVTVIGGGGGGGGAGGTDAAGGNGGTTTFDAGGAGTVSAAGGVGGPKSAGNAVGVSAGAGLVSANIGRGGHRESVDKFGKDGLGGAITVGYLNLTGISTWTVTIGAGGTAGTGDTAGGAGGAGRVVVEYVAA